MAMPNSLNDISVEDIKMPMDKLTIPATIPFQNVNCDWGIPLMSTVKWLSAPQHKHAIATKIPAVIPEKHSTLVNRAAAINMSAVVGQAKGFR